MKIQVANKENVARLRGSEPPASGSGDQLQNAMLMILLAQSCTVLAGSVCYSALNGPKSDPIFLPELERKAFRHVSKLTCSAPQSNAKAMRKCVGPGAN